MPIINFNWKDIIRGESYSDFAPTGGFSPTSHGINLLKDPGVLNFTENQAEHGGATLTGDIIASADDLNFSGNDKYFVDEGGAFYTYSGTTLTKRQTATVGNWDLGTTDMLQFKLSTYATADDRVIEATGSDLAGFDSGWWTGLNSNNRHPLERVEDELFIADGNIIYYWNGASSGTAFTLPTENKCTTLRKHPNGRTLLAFTGLTANYSHDNPSAGRVYYCDPLTRYWTREVDLFAQVEGSRVVGGTVITTYGKTIGLFDGSGLVPLRKLNTSATTYSHSISNLEDILLVRDGRLIKCYGDVGAGKVWWNVTRNNDLDVVNTVTTKGGNVILWGDAGTDLREVDLDDAGANADFYMNRIYFDKEVVINRIEILHSDAASGGFSINYSDVHNNTNTVDTTAFNTGRMMDTVNCEIRTDLMQLNIGPSGTTNIKMIRIHYHDA